MDDVEYKFTKPLGLAEILDAFPEEALRLVPRSIKVLKRELEPFFAYSRSVRANWRYSEEFREFCSQICQRIYMPKKKFDHLQNLKVMERLMCKTTRGVNESDIEQAKGVDIWTLHNFNGRRGRTACCPFHDDKTPSFSVKKNRFICFACGVKGDSIDFVQKMNNLPFYKAVEFLVKHG
jgi:hypothetical protein